LRYAEEGREEEVGEEASRASKHTKCWSLPRPRMLLVLMVSNGDEVVVVVMVVMMKMVAMML
jgi:hypothetical protein